MMERFRSSDVDILTEIRRDLQRQTLRTSSKWGGVGNGAALVAGQQAQIAADQAAYSVGQIAGASVKTHGAIGNGSANDHDAIIATINALPTWGGVVVLPPGDYYCDPGLSWPDNVTLQGSGWRNTRLIRNSDIVLLDSSGASSASRHNGGVSLRDITLWGSAVTTHTKPLMRSYYTGRHDFTNVRFHQCGGPGFEAVEHWDTVAYNLWFDQCGMNGADNLQALRYLSMKEGTTSGQFGYSTDNSNNFYGTNLEFTSNKSGDMHLGQNGLGNFCHRIYLNNVKLETESLHRRLVFLDWLIYCSFTNWNVHPVSFASGSSGEQNMIKAGNVIDSEFEHITFETTSALARAGIDFEGCGNIALDSIWQEGTIGTAGTLNFNGNNTGIQMPRVFNGNVTGAPSDNVTAATTTTLPSGEFILVNGTTPITGITASWPQRRVILRFSGTATGNGLTDGGNLKLNGHFPWTPDDMIVLVSDGTNWYEENRSAN